MQPTIYKYLGTFVYFTHYTGLKSPISFILRTILDFLNILGNSRKQTLIH